MHFFSSSLIQNVYSSVTSPLDHDLSTISVKGLPTSRVWSSFIQHLLSLFSLVPKLQTLPACLMSLSYRLRERLTAYRVAPDEISYLLAPGSPVFGSSRWPMVAPQIIARCSLGVGLLSVNQGDIVIAPTDCAIWVFTHRPANRLK